uniref:Sugar phosphate transporter domain-containing protein n=1 Tax=Meloidogyne incognita TaxID=6306 RepID=A0A914KWB8_MELIC
MFTVLRRFSIFLTMLFEYFILGIIPTFGVKFSVFLMILGSAIAAMFDLSFDSLGYLLICFNNFATALNGVYMKKKLNSKAGKNGLLFYNSLFMLLPLIGFILLNNEETEKLRIYIDQGYLTIPVLLFLLLSCIGGLLLNYSVVLCTSHNSALTTVCVGPIKNMFVTYIGMISSGDYIFTWNNFIGINISVFGSILYTYVTFRTNERIISRTDIASIKIKEGERETLL